MRIWDLPVERLCRRHLLAEHRELHAIWSILTQGRQGYACHPETLRWRGKLRALYERHEQQVREMRRRGYRHKTPLPAELGTGLAVQDQQVDSLERQEQILRAKGCGCRRGLEAPSDTGRS